VPGTTRAADTRPYLPGFASGRRRRPDWRRTTWMIGTTSGLPRGVRVRQRRQRRQRRQGVHYSSRSMNEGRALRCAGAARARPAHGRRPCHHRQRHPWHRALHRGRHGAEHGRDGLRPHKGCDDLPPRGHGGRGAGTRLRLPGRDQRHRRRRRRGHGPRIRDTASLRLPIGLAGFAAWCMHARCIRVPPQTHHAIAGPRPFHYRQSDGTRPHWPWEDGRV
jgi:hypothetical protein